MFGMEMRIKQVISYIYTTAFQESLLKNSLHTNSLNKTESLSFCVFFFVSFVSKGNILDFYFTTANSFLTASFGKRLS